MKILFVACALLLSGCMYQSVNSFDIESAKKICTKKNTEIVDIRANFLGGEAVLCSDGQVYAIKTENMQ